MNLWKFLVHVILKLHLENFEHYFASIWVSLQLWGSLNILWRKWQPTPVFLPGKSHGQKSLVGYSPWGHKELDTTEWLTHSLGLEWKLTFPRPVATAEFSNFAGIFVQCFPCGLAGKESACNVGDLGLIPGLGRSPGEGKGYPLQYSGLENSLNCIVHGVAKNQTQLRNFHFHFTFTVSSFRIWNSSAGIPSPPLAFFIVMLPMAHLNFHSGMSDQ